MKKLIFCALFTGTVLGLFAQDITISFQPKDSGNTIDSVWVTNQTTGQKVKLVGSEFLTLTKTTGIDVLSSLSRNGYLYPNPCYGEAQLSFYSSMSQEVKLQVYNISGQLLTFKRQKLETGQHRFNVVFPSEGLFTVSVMKDDGSFSIKGICIRPGGQNFGIEYGGNEYHNPTKSAIMGKTLSYTHGDILLHSVFSGKNNTIITDSPIATKAYPVEFYECIDLDKRNYKVVKIGTQWWMAENLAYLPAVSPEGSESTNSPHYYIYDFNGTDVTAGKATENYSIYGVLYNWTAALSACPAGWHLPSDSEWTTLTDYLIDNGYGYGGSGDDIAKSIASTTNWSYYNEPNTPGSNPSSNNSSGFSGLPAGFYGNSSVHWDLTDSGTWWSSTQDTNDYAWARAIRVYYHIVYRYARSTSWGYSIRCLKDN